MHGEGLLHGFGVSLGGEEMSGNLIEVVVANQRNEMALDCTLENEEALVLWYVSFTSVGVPCRHLLFACVHRGPALVVGGLQR